MSSCAGSLDLQAVSWQQRVERSLAFFKKKHLYGSVVLFCVSLGVEVFICSRVNMRFCSAVFLGLLAMSFVCDTFGLNNPIHIL